VVRGRERERERYKTTKRKGSTKKNTLLNGSARRKVLAVAEMYKEENFLTKLFATIN
jgi:hypothetical protein